MNDMNSGYNGFSMSNRAVQAYEDGEKPLSKWTKAEIMDIIEYHVKDEVANQTLKKAPLSFLKKHFYIAVHGITQAVTVMKLTSIHLILKSWKNYLKRTLKNLKRKLRNSNHYRKKIN